MNKPISAKVPLSGRSYEPPSSQARLKSWRWSWQQLVLILIITMAAAFALFLLLARSIQVTVVETDLQNMQSTLPVAAKTSLDSLFKLPIGDRMLILGGDVTVSVVAPGYAALNQTITVGEAKFQQFELMLERLPGNLDIRVTNAEASSGETPPKQILGAQYTIDDQLVGSSPGLIEDITAGSQTITVDAPLYRAQTIEVLVEGKSTTQRLDIALEPAWATYELSANQSDVSIYVNGFDRGKLPQLVALEEGVNKITLKKNKFKTLDHQVIVTANEDAVLPTFELEPADAIVSVSTTPSGAAVLVDGRFFGSSPIEFSTAVAASAELKIFKPGFKAYDSTVNLAAAEVLQVDHSLVPEQVPVKVSVTPADAQVFVDGAMVGRGSQDLRLTTLPHTIRVSASGYEAQSRQIAPSRNSNQIFSFKLLTNEESFWANLPARYSNRVGGEMVLFREPGRTQMGSGRQEPNRRSNEVAYSAELSRPFYVGTKEITNKQFREFRSVHSSGNYKRKSLDKADFPAVNVSWQQAALFCNWLSKKEGLVPFYTTESGYVSGHNISSNGYRLPTEVEWTWLATGGKDDRPVFPWGNDPEGVAKPINKENWADQKAQDLITFTIDGYNDGFSAAAEVGSFKPNQNGLFDLYGNASEWMHDWYSAEGNLELSQQDLIDPLGPEIGEFHVVKGASWARGYLPQLRTAYRDYGAKGKYDIGFRVVRYAKTL
ncbi:MAG: PEGA domain-containing protein [Pseudomonadota bacterium]